MGKFGKKTFTTYIQSECERLLFLELGENDSNMIAGSKAIQKSDRFMREDRYRTALGSKYEQKVYNALITFPRVKYTRSTKPNNPIVKTPLTNTILKKYYQEMLSIPNQSQLLLEHEYLTPKAFKNAIFPPKKGKITIAKEFSEGERPDVIILTNYAQKVEGKDSTSTSSQLMELLPSGAIRELPKSELKHRIGIRILDIKVTEEENVGKRQFIEIFYYMRTLSYFLEEEGLQEKFFVQISHNGILPAHVDFENEVSPPNIPTINDLYSYVVEISWFDSHRIFDTTLDKMRELWQRSPLKISQTEVNLQPSCGYCVFLEDCEKRLNMKESIPPKDYSLELIPYMSKSISKQLKEMGFQTIGDVHTHFDKIDIGVTPTPLSAELPLLRLKAQSLVQNKLVTPPRGHVHSYAIPRYVSQAIYFCCEADPTNERSYVAGMFVKMSNSPKSKIFTPFNKWWQTWEWAIDQKKLNPTYDEVLFYQEIKQKLDAFLEYSISIEEVMDFWDSLTMLRKTPENPNNPYVLTRNLLKIKNYTEPPPSEDTEKSEASTNSDPRTSSESSPHVSGFLNYNVLIRFEVFNHSLDAQDELKFATKILRYAFWIVKICSMVEKYVIAIDDKTDRIYSPNTAFFYWSQRQLDNVQELLERNLENFLQDPTLFPLFSQLSDWFSPNESDITNPYQHKKFFNLQTFAESVLGFPLVLNYTWHEILANQSEKVTEASQYYWIKHFNYMDFQVWHDYLYQKEIKFQDPNELDKKEEKIKKQIWFKLNALKQLKQIFVKNAAFGISDHSKPIRSEQFSKEKAILSSQYHLLAKIWCLFSKLTGTADEYEKESIRTIYPEFSIGKLMAGKVDRLQIYKTHAKGGYEYTFILKDMSSNMKISEKDRFLLLPDEHRDLFMGPWTQKWQIDIEKLLWEEKMGGYRVFTKKTKTDFENLYKNTIENPVENPDWFLYPIALDAWTNKLLGTTKKAGLVDLKLLGTSWLGFRLAYLWNLEANLRSRPPKHWRFTAPEVYFYAPNLLLNPHNLPHSASTSQKLLTEISPPPDPSQTRAIQSALNHSLFGIQGPPGTGKSQTITALIDEFSYRQKELPEENKPVKILITAFSYAAIRVLIDKICLSQNTHGGPSSVAQLQKIFIRSPWQDPIDPRLGPRPVDDIVRENGTWKINGKKGSLTKRHRLEESLEKDYIIFANAHMLYHLFTDERVQSNFTFNLIIVDEASQVPTDQFLPSLLYLQPQQFMCTPLGGLRQAQTDPEIKTSLRNLTLSKPVEEKFLTKVIIVGDYNQLPPVQPVEPPEKLGVALDSLFAYYVKYHGIPSYQLEINYRSHQDIVTYTNHLGFYTNLQASRFTAHVKLAGNIDRVKQPWIKTVLNPEYVVSTLIHAHQHEIAVSPIEALIAAQLVIGYYRMVEPTTAKMEEKFWTEMVGVVAPHNAQGRTIIRKIFELMTNSTPTLTKLSTQKLMSLIKNTVYSVEKFQGSDRNLIIASTGLSDVDQIHAETEFIYDLNRFNVLSSRAKHKLILITSQKFLDFIPQDRDYMNQAGRVRYYAFQFCNQEKSVFLPNIKGNLEKINFRWYDATMQVSLNEVEKTEFSFLRDEEWFYVEFVKNSDYMNIFQRIPAEISKTEQSPQFFHDNAQAWQFAFEDLDKITPYIPIPSHFLQEFNQKYHALVKISEEDMSPRPDTEESLESTQSKDSAREKTISFDLGVEGETENDDLF